MNSMNYIGLDIHKKSISCCVRQADGTIIQESTIAATRHALDEWMRQLPQSWMAGMEATLFTGWIYDHLESCGATVKVAHPAMLQAIAAGKKNDRVDARKIADLLRCDYFPECHMASREIRDRRRVLRYRNLLVRQAVQMKNKVSGLLMEAGVPYNQQKVHQKKYFAELLQRRFARTGTREEHFDLNQLIQDTTLHLQEYAQRQNVLVRTHLEDPLPPFFGDRTQLRQLVINLARNAIEATKNALHEARLVVIRTKSEGSSGVRLEVSDCGVGIQPGERERIFQPFFTTKEGGLGMSLSISRTIVESHGGRILVEPNQPHGTRFLVLLPNERMT